MKKSLVAVIMGSYSDYEVMKEAINTLDELKIPYEVRIISAHRTPDEMYKFAKEAEKKGIDVIIAGAGGSAHLPGMTASLTTVPVIGVPIKSAYLNGVDSLLSIVQMPGGIPVATVAINGAKNAALLAAQILSIKNKNIKKNLEKYREKLTNEVIRKDLEIRKST
ncbi:MAG: 5-(carboxyamino)imidazole ribonucleotide mutase, partial [Elusimicrobiales bacterium]|nr:5-(carboxyamino)imidazole ribonucleotide mutase [Elusimicrobiales bacterium]